jgi:hypothetical protein
MTKNNIIIAHPELLVGQALSQLISVSSDRVGRVVQLSTDMAAIRAGFFQQQPLPVLASFTQDANWLLIADLGSLLAQEACKQKSSFNQTQANNAMGLAVYHLSILGLTKGELIFTQPKWLGDIAYSTNSAAFIPTLERTIQLMRTPLPAPYYPVVETRDAVVIKTRVGVQ